MPKIPSFLDVLHANAPAAKAQVHVIPAPMETTVCYGGGTARAPRAILEASRQLDDFDGRRWPTDLAIHTQPFVKPAAGKGSATERWLAGIEKAVAKALRCGALPAVLGGEHTATLGSARALKAAGADVGFIHFDAHADLRDVYKGTKLSHACVLRRVHELGFPLVQLATRAVSREEADYRAENEKTIRAYDARFLAARKIVGFDVVELAPMRGLHHPDYTAALLVYALMAAAARS